MKNFYTLEKTCDFSVFDQTVNKPKKVERQKALEYATNQILAHVLFLIPITVQLKLLLTGFRAVLRLLLKRLQNIVHIILNQRLAYSNLFFLIYKISFNPSPLIVHYYLVSAFVHKLQRPHFLYCFILPYN